MARRENRDEEICGECEFAQYATSRTDSDISCNNPESDFYGVPTWYDSTCEYWHKKGVR